MSGKRTPTLPGINPPSKRVVRLCTRHLRLVAKGKEKFDKANETLKTAINAGLLLDQPVEIETVDDNGQPKKELFALVNNFSAEVVYKAARIARFELKKVPKFKREKTEVAA